MRSGTIRLIHLNNAGAALMPAPVVDAIQGHIALEAAIGGYEAAYVRRGEIEATYEEVASLVNARPLNVALTSSATAAFIQAISAFDLAPGDTIVTTQTDYTSYQIQLLSLAQRTGVTVLHAAELPEGGVDPESVHRLARGGRCRLVTVSWMPTHSGLVQDVESVGEVCDDLGVPYHVDACQAVGQIPIDVQRLRCDYLSATARKFLRGPRGIGFLYVSDAALVRGDCPLYVDMRGATWVTPERFEVQPTARRFEDWEFAYALVLGLGAAARYAETTVTVLAPAGIQFPASIVNNPLCRGKRFNFLSLEAFSREERDKMRMHYQLSAHSSDQDGSWHQFYALMVRFWT